MNRLRDMIYPIDQVRLIVSILTDDVKKRHSSNILARGIFRSHVAADRIDVCVEQIFLGSL